MVDPSSNVRDFPRQVEPLLPRATPASAIEQQSIQWRWKGRLAAGKIVVLDGDPGLGKSTITLDIAARITRGRALPGDIGWVDDEPVTLPRNVMVLSAEDGRGDTIVPRLVAANADLKKIIFFDLVDLEGNEQLPSLSAHLREIEQHVISSKAALLIIDPLMAFLSSETNSNRDQDVRRVLSPLSTMAERTGCAVLVLRHLNKNAGMSSLYRGGGSIGIIGAARIGLLAAKDHRDETGQRRAIIVQKCNIGPEAASLAYRIVGLENSDSSRVEWLGETDLTANQVHSAQEDPADRDDLKDSEAWLIDYLKEGPAAVVDLLREGKKAGFSERTLKRSKQSLSIKAERYGYGKDGSWRWALPFGFTKPVPTAEYTTKTTTAESVWNDEP